MRASSRTASRISGRVNSGTASYHLRRLAAAGFVEEDTERGNARERWWRSLHQVTRLADSELARQEPEAVPAYLRSVAAAHSPLTQRALNELQTMPRPWSDELDISHWALRLTLEEAGRLHEELLAVVARYRREVPEEPAAERVSLVMYLLPEPDASESDPP